MSINLLSLARSSASGLHNSGRGGGKSYASGTSYGNKIAGTNISHGAGLTNLAKKGRGGDTKIRKVAGQPSHVNKQEARAIDSLGPLGEAWVQNVGSGTINPKTGLREYGFFKKSRWRPSAGKWGIFGQTRKSKDADKKKAEAATRRADYKKFRREYEDENIAGIFTEDPSDDTSLLADYTGTADFKKLIKDKSGLNNPSGFTTDNEIDDYLDEYDTRKETELVDASAAAIDKLNLGESVSTAAAGSQLSTQQFGQLSEAQTTMGTQNFASSGDFAGDMQRKFAVEQTERDVNAGRTLTQIDKEQTEDDMASGVQDLQENYNQEFWNAMQAWDSAINA